MFHHKRGKFMSRKKAPVPVMLRLPSELHDFVSNQALIEHRSMNGQIVYMLSGLMKLQEAIKPHTSIVLPDVPITAPAPD
jgi:hypothetical protein